MPAKRIWLAGEKLLRVAGVAPRFAGPGPEFSYSASQKSLSPMPWVTCAQQRPTMWLHSPNVRALLSIPVSCVNRGTKWLQHYKSDGQPSILPRLESFCFSSSAVRQDFRHFPTLFQFPVGWQWIHLPFAPTKSPNHYPSAAAWEVDNSSETFSVASSWLIFEALSKRKQKELQSNSQFRPKIVFLLPCRHISKLCSNHRR